MRHLIALPIVIVTIWFAQPKLTFAAPPTWAKDLITGWESLQGRQFRGIIQEVGPNQAIVNETTFVASFGHASKKRMMPYSICLVEPNPGEPHISEQEICSTAFVHNGEIGGIFERQLITAHKTLTYSNQDLRLYNDIPLNFRSILLVLDIGIDGFPAHEGFGSTESTLKNFEFKDLGGETFLNIPAARVRMTSNRPMVPGSVPLRPLEFLISNETPRQILEVFNTADDSSTKPWLIQWAFQRKIHRIEVLDGSVTPTDVSLTWSNKNKQFRIRIQEAKALPPTFVGAWEFEKQSGVVFSNGEPDFVRKYISGAGDYTRYAAVMPFTSSEEEAIRRYVVSQTAVVAVPIAWSRILLYTVNVVALCFLAWVTWKKVRAG